MSSQLSSERGAILMHVAIASVVLIAFSMFVVDYGVMWVSRSQAQNAADAGALAGAVALGFDDSTNRANDGPVKQSAQQFALLNGVFGESPDVDIDTDVIFYADDPSKFPAECDDGTCIRVDVYRNQARANPLPMMFGQLVGLTTQGVRATAIARAAAANASRCMKPWAVADKWEEHNPLPVVPWNANSEFYGGGPNPDVYRPPSESDPGTGFTLAADLGREFILKTGNPHGTINPGWFQALDLTGGGGASYRSNIGGCADVLWKIGDDVPKENGNMVGPTKQGVGDLIAQDPNADWDPISKKVILSDFDSSPRIVAVPVFDLALYMATGGPGNGTVRIVNILGFFVDRMDGNDVVGYLCAKPDLLIAGGATITGEAAFLRNISLIR